MKKVARRISWAYIFMLLSIPILWVGFITITKFPPFLVPPPQLVGKVLIDEAGTFAHHTAVTLFVAGLGYLLANLVALVVAIGFLYLPRLEGFATPWMIVIKNVPFIVIASIIVIIMGQTIWPRLIIVVLISFFPLVANLQTGLNDVDQALLDRMRVLNATRWQVFWKIRWPASLPYYMAAHEIAFTTSIIGAIVAEWFFATEGLGFLILRSMNQYRADKVYAVTIIASVLAVGIYIFIKSVEKRMFAWKEDRANGS